MSNFVKKIYMHYRTLILAKRAVWLLNKAGLTVATAESCTGGLLAAALTSVTGVSRVFNEGYVTYANAAKESLLGVRADTLRRYGAVSKQVAVEMAAGARRRSGADISVAVTGLAGPGGGSVAKPVGTVYIAVDTDDGVVCHRYAYSGNRAEIRAKTVICALRYLT